MTYTPIIIQAIRLIAHGIRGGDKSYLRNVCNNLNTDQEEEKNTRINEVGSVPASLGKPPRPSFLFFFFLSSCVTLTHIYIQKGSPSLILGLIRESPLFSLKYSKIHIEEIPYFRLETRISFI